MEYELTNQFLRDIRRYKTDKTFVRAIGARINETISAKELNDIHGLVLIRGTTAHFRFKIRSGNTTYRIGIKKLKNVIWFACVENNKSRFYKGFP